MPETSGRLEAMGSENRLCRARRSRHSTAISTLEATGDIRKVSLWLGHASIQSTEFCLRAAPVGKLGILSGNRPPAIARGTFRDASDRLLAILQDARTPRQS